jgi:hypothetical protein
MKDIIEVLDGQDLNVMDTPLPKAGNVLSIQLGSLEYALDFGVDLKFFLDSELKFQNESFKAYLVQRLTENQINVAEVIDFVGPLFEKYTFYVGDLKPSNGGMIL